MALRFVIGPSGVGKSTWLRNMVIERSLSDKERHFLIVVPDQFTLETQLEYVKAHPRHGIMNIDILSFGRLSHRIFDETGFPTVPVLDDMGKTLVLRRVASLIADKIPGLGAGMRKLGFIDEVKSTISEFMQYRIEPESIDHLISAAGSRKTLAIRLNETKIIYRAFLDYIHDHFITKEETLGLLCRKLPESGLIKDSVIVFDGFTGFTPIQYEVLRVLLGLAGDIYVSVTADTSQRADSVREGKSSVYDYSPEDEDIFALSRKTIRDLEHIEWEITCGAPGSPVQGMNFFEWKKRREESSADLLLDGLLRYEEKSPGELHFLSSHIFRYDAKIYDRETVGSLELFEAVNRRQEVREVLRRIHRLTYGDIKSVSGETERETSAIRYDHKGTGIGSASGTQFRDIAVICGSLSEYADIIEEEAGRLGIPVYIDQTVKPRQNPLTATIRGALRTLRSGYSYEEMMPYIRGGLLDIDDESADELDNYVRMLGIRGEKRWNEEFFIVPEAVRRRKGFDEGKHLEYLEMLNRARKAVTAPLMILSGSTEGSTDGSTVEERSRRLVDFLVCLDAGRKLNGFAEDFKDTDPLRAREYESIYSGVTSLLDQMAGLIGGDKLTLREYCDILDAGLSDIEVGRIPQSVDRVLVGDLMRTRLRDVHYLFLIGAGDDAIPKASGTGGIISDLDREYLRENVSGIELAPTPRQQIHIERLYLYLTLAKPDRGLTVSSPRSAGDGRTIRPSFLFGNISKLFPGIKKEYYSETTLQDAAITDESLMEVMPERLRAYAAGELSDEQDLELRILYQTLGEREALAARLGSMRNAAFANYRNVRLSDTAVKILYGTSTLSSSVSRLEKYQACPYAHFLQYGLGLSVRPEYEFGVTDLGNIYHSALDAFNQRLLSVNLRWRDLSPEECRKIMEESMAGIVKGYGDSVLYSSNRRKYQVERITRILVRTANTLRYQLSKGDFEPAASEKRFALDLGRLTVYGSIDRLDITGGPGRTFVKILDFKSGIRNLDLTGIAAGLQLQLPAYMEAAMDLLQKENNGVSRLVPSALLYYRVNDPLVRLGDAVTTDEGYSKDTDIFMGKRVEALRTTGLVNSEPESLAHLDRDLFNPDSMEPAGGASSMVIPVRLKKDGGFTASSSVMTTDEYHVMADHVKKVLIKSADGILKGDISITPYSYDKMSACEWCSYRSICGFDLRIRGYGCREIRKMSADEAFMMMSEGTVK